MPTGAFTEYLDVAQVVLYAFWFFFAGLLFYLRREDRREGYPLESDVTGKPDNIGLIWIPPKKTFRLEHGQQRLVESGRDDKRHIAATPIGNWPGAPLEPTGNPLLDGVGPAAYAERADEPDLTYEGMPRIVPLRVLEDFYLDTRDPDPIGMKVMGADRRMAGTVYDVWVDRSEIIVRYLEVELPRRTENEPLPDHRILIPITMAVVNRTTGQVEVDATAIDVLRDRERGVPRYCEFRRLLDMPVPKSFEELTTDPEWRRELGDVYSTVEDVDLLVGTLVEGRSELGLPPGFGFSDTVFRIFILMASRRLKSDRFFTDDFTPEVYTPEGWDWIEQNGFRDVLVRHCPDLAPHFADCRNVFFPWTKTAEE